MEKKPMVSVVMPVYNCEMYIEASVNSILNQTFTDFELLIIDDCSTDKTKDIIKGFDDKRIIFIEKPKNTGYTNSLNYALQLVNGKYIARMDGDDVSLLNRFKAQVDFLENNEDVVACGTIFKYLNTETTIGLPEYDGDIKLAMLSGNSMAHPSVMMRSSVIREHKIQYNKEREPAEDYDLWVELMTFGKLHNLQKVYLEYRKHTSQVSAVRRMQQNESAIKTRIKLIKYVYKDLPLYHEENLVEIYRQEQRSFSDVKQYLDFKNEFLIRNNGFFKKEGVSIYFSNVEKKLLKNYLLKRNSFSFRALFEYLKLRSMLSYKSTFTESLKLILKSFMLFKYRVCF
ncbi:glycosyltransferase family 2 protein [Seonamhaeicola marinus]|uniref:Glycosyltransferase family 2 protein n=1 Tax=Seonamhaeicola marinus TaxID=1912246 RepID=A0A5D0HJ46_9FLAO|nr:glycosyltransferase family 2 protein [Seonamhaeicola marinus]TYA71413.1 glycosyltransferase family 2 protein [Seonamhaeicola marinus]